MKNNFIRQQWCVWLLCLGCLGAGTVSAQTRHYVNLNATGTNNGMSWVNAYTDLQAAINAAAVNDEIWVAAGTYKPLQFLEPTYQLPQDKTFYLNKNIKVYGGFLATETNLSERNPTLNVTTLSGDLNGDDVVTSNGTTLIFRNNVDNVYHVLITRNLTSEAIIDGFTIRGGNATDSQGRIFGIYGAAGGAIYNGNSSPTIQQCKFLENNASWYGGSICNSAASSPIIINCSFSKSFASMGAVYNYSYSSPKFTNCTFTQNFGNYGGAIYAQYLCSIEITNCSFYGNVSNNGGGAIYNHDGNLMFVRNSILWENGSNEVRSYNNQPTFQNSIIKGSGSSNWNASFGSNNGNNLDVNPCFVTGLLTLQSNSPALNAGNSTFNTTSTDLAGNPRIQNGTIDIGAYEGAACQVRFTNLNPTIRQGESIVVNGRSYTQTGTYRDTIIRTNLCDSIITTQLTVLSTINSAITASQCGDRSYRLPSGRTVNAVGIYRDTIRHTDAPNSTYIVTLLTDLSCRCQDSIGLQSMYHTSGGTFPWDLRQNISTFKGVTVNAQGCVTAFRDPRAAIDSCVQLQGNYNLISDFGFFNLLRDSVQNRWSRNGIHLLETPILNIAPLRREDTGSYVCQMTFPAGAIAAFKDLTLVENRAIRLKFCCTTTRDTVRQTICQGNCVDWDGITRCESGTYNQMVANANVCDTTIHTLILTVLPNDIQLCLQQIGATLIASDCTNRHSYTYLWSTGATTNHILAGTGRYSVTVTNAVGCKKDTSVVVNPSLWERYASDTVNSACPNLTACMNIRVRQPITGVTAISLSIPFDTTLMTPSHYVLGRVVEGSVIETRFNNRWELTIYTSRNLTAQMGDSILQLCWNLTPAFRKPSNEAKISVFLEDHAGATSILDTLQGYLRITGSSAIELKAWADMTHLMPAAATTNTQTYASYKTPMGTKRDSFKADATVILRHLNDTIVKVSRNSLRDPSQTVLTSLDAFYIHHYRVQDPNFQFTKEQILRMDCDGDHRVTAQDVTWAMRRATNIFPIGFPQVLRRDTIESWRHLFKSEVNDLQLSPNNLPIIKPIVIPLAARNSCDTAKLDILSYAIGDVDMSYSNSGNTTLGRLQVEKVALCHAMELGNNLYGISVWASNTMHGLDIKLFEHTNHMQLVGIDEIASHISLLPNIDSTNKSCYIAAYSTTGQGIPAHKKLFRLLVRKATRPVAADFVNIASLLDGKMAETDILLSNCITALPLESSLPFVKMYPNPTSGVVTVESDQNVGMIRVYDALGRLFLQQAATDLRTDLDLTGAAVGVYFVRIGEQSYKIVKN